MPDEEPNPPPPLAYERAGGMTRGGFRLLLLLTFINTLLLSINLMGPQTWQAVRGVYAGFVQRRAEAAAAAKREAVQRAALSAAVRFQFPEKHVAYTEVPDEAMRLIAQGLPYQPIQPDNDSSQPPLGWQAPVIANPPPALLQHEPLGTEGTLFVHERTAPNGTKMLVLVVVRATYAISSETGVADDVEETTYRLSRQRRLQSVAFTTSPNGEVTNERQYELDLILPDAQPTEVAVSRQPRSAREAATAPLIRPGHPMRFFGGNPDPADSSHFTIPFELDGKPGVIDGWLRDDTLVLTPRQGHAVPSARHPAWDLLPATQPAAKS